MTDRPGVEAQFADQLHYLRARRAKVTQGELAKAMHVHPVTISDWERGEALPHLKMVERLADYFRTRLDDTTVEFRFNHVSTSQVGKS